MAFPFPPPRDPGRQSNRSFAGRVLVAVAIVAATFLLIWLLGRAVDVFLVLFAAVLFGIFVGRLADLLKEHIGLPYGVALALVVVLLFAVAIGSAWLLAPSLMAEGKEMSQKMPQALENLREHARGLPFGEQLLKSLPSPGTDLFTESQTMKRVLGAFSTTVGALANLLVIVVIGIYLASSPYSLTEGIIKLVPISKRERAREVLYTLGITLWGWMKGTLLAMLIIGLATTIGLSLIGVPLSLLLGMIAGLFEFVPNIGPFIAGAPAVALALLNGPAQALYVVVLFVLVQSLEGYVLTPLLQKKVIDLPPVLTLSGQLVMGLLTGILGLILAVPLMAVLMVLVRMLYIEDVLGDKTTTLKAEKEAEKKIEEHQDEIQKAIKED